MDWGVFRPSKSTSVCLALLAFSFLLMTFRLTGAVKNFRTFVLYWIFPVQETASGAILSASQVGSNLIDLVKADQENERLREKVLQASLLETQYKETLLENKRLRHMLELKSALPFHSQAAQVTARDAHGWAQFVWVNRGTKDRVTPDSPVVAVEPDGADGPNVVKGLIGRVLECGANSSKVLLITDPLSSVAVSVPRIGEQGLVQGQGLDLTVEYLELSSQVQSGDEVVTSGLGGIFPAGIPVGTLTRVEAYASGFKRGILKPSVSLNRLREVLVLKMEKAG